GTHAASHGGARLMQRPQSGVDDSSGNAHRAQRVVLRGMSASQAAHRLKAPCPRTPHNRQWEGSSASNAPSTKQVVLKLTDIPIPFDTSRSRHAGEGARQTGLPE
ncbi:MAG: hypothetical protein KGQ32_06770, partial [Xanthomonadaceae bacterium]|nr:hypothetical protein [Xanthomonadaceae bacterium]